MENRSKSLCLKLNIILNEQFKGSKNYLAGKTYNNFGMNG